MLLDEEIVDYRELISNQKYFNDKVNEAHEFVQSQGQKTA